MDFDKLELGDWLQHGSIGTYYVVYGINYEHELLELSSPDFLLDEIITYPRGVYEYAGFSLVGKSKPNPWYNFFGWTKIVFPYKMIPLREWQDNVLMDWVDGK